MSNDDVLTESIFFLGIIFIHIAAGNGEYCSICREGKASDGGLKPVELTESLLVVSVPNVDEPITAARSECVMFPVEGDGVHRVNVLYPVLFQAVTFECVFLLLSLGAGVEHLHRNSPLDGAEDVTSFVGERLDTSGLILETALSLLLWTGHVPEVPDENFPAGSGDHEMFPGAGHAVHLVRLTVTPSAGHL